MFIYDFKGSGGGGGGKPTRGGRIRRAARRIGAAIRRAIGGR